MRRSSLAASPDVDSRTCRSRTDLITFQARCICLFFCRHRQINLLPMLMAVVFSSAEVHAASPTAATPEQAQQQKMMKWMSPFMFPIFLYSGPSGLNLYILTSTAIGIIESKIVRDHIKAREEAEKAGRVSSTPSPRGLEAEQARCLCGPCQGGPGTAKAHGWVGSPICRRRRSKSAETRTNGNIGNPV